MTKIKPLLPTLREKKRYLVFEVIADKPFSNFSIVSRNLWANILRVLGSLGAAKAGIWMLPDKFDPKTQRGIIRVSHKHVDDLKASLALTSHLGDKAVIIRSLGVSGVLRKAISKFMEG